MREGKKEGKGKGGREGKRGKRAKGKQKYQKSFLKNQEGPCS